MFSFTIIVLYILLFFMHVEGLLPGCLCLVTSLSSEQNLEYNLKDAIKSCILLHWPLDEMV